MEELYAKISDELSAGKAVLWVLVAEGHGSSPRGAGAAMAIFEDGTSTGTVGGGALEHEAQKTGARLLQQKKSARQTFNLAPNDAANLGMVCGGVVTLLFLYTPPEKAAEFFTQLTEAMCTHRRLWFAVHFDCSHNSWQAALLKQNGDIVAATSQLTEAGFDKTIFSGKPMLAEYENTILYSQPVAAAGQVYLFGGGHVAQQLVPVLSKIFFSCVVIDDRAEFANKELFPDAYRLMVRNFSDVFAELTITADDYIVVLTRGHLSDSEVLAQALKTPAKYIGMIGSKNKINACFTKLVAEQGYRYSDIQRVHAPIGLPTGGETPQEIAISIAAEMLAVRNNKHITF